MEWKYSIKVEIPQICTSTQYLSNLTFSVWSVPDVLQCDWLLLHKTTPHAVYVHRPVSEQTVTADTQTTADRPTHI